MTIDEILHFNLNSILLLHGMNASNKQEALVKSLTSAWEKKNSKVARAGGVSLMALSLAACGGSDDTPFSQVDVDAAVTAANAAAAAEAAAAATAAAASEAAAVAAAEATAAEAATAAATAAAASEAASVAAAEATAAEAATAAATAAAASEAAAVAAATAAAEAAAAADIAAANAAKTTAEAAAATAATAQAAAETAKAAAETAQATAEAARDVALADKATAEAAQAAAETAKVAAEAAKVAAENATAIAEAAKATAEASLATLQTTYDALLVDYNALANPPAVDTTINLTSSIDNKSSGAGNDIYYALNSGDLATGDIIAAGDGTDILYANYTSVDGTTQSIRPVFTGLETVQLTITDGDAGGDTVTLNLDQSSGVTSVIFGNKAFNGAADTIVASGITTATSVTVKDDAGHASANANDYTVTYSDAAAGTADTATLNLQETTADGTFGTVTVNNVETLNVNLSGGYDVGATVNADAATTMTIDAAADAVATDTDANAIDVGSAVMTTLNVNASNDVTITDAGTAAAVLYTVNADARTASSEITLTTLTPTATTGADTFTVNASGTGTVVYTAENTNFGAQTATNADSIVVNGTNNSGGVTADLDGLTTGAPAVLSVTGGSGNDEVIVLHASGTTGMLAANDTIALGDGTGDKLSATVTYDGSNNAEDIFYDSDDSDTSDDPTISGVEIASLTLSDAGGAHIVDASSAAFASTLELMGDIENASHTISDIALGQTVKLGSTLDMTDASSSVVLNQVGATTSAPTASLTITSDLLETSTDGNIDSLVSDMVSAVSLDLASTDADVVTATVDVASFALASSVTVTSAENITFSDLDAANAATLDFSGATGTVSVAATAADDYTILGSNTAATTFVMAAGLDADDQLTGGSATTDKATATVTGLTATTGAVSSTGVELYELTNTTTAVVDFTGTTGVTDIAVNGAHATNDVMTIQGVDAGTSVTLGNGTTAHVGTLTVALEDATGGSDSLTVNMTGLGTGGLTNLTTSGIETLNLVGGDAMDAQELGLANSDVSKVVVTGGNDTPVALGLAGTGAVALNANIAEVDASGYNGAITAVASTNTATTMLSGVGGSTMTGASAADNFTAGSTSGYITGSVAITNGGAGSDTLNAYVKNNADFNDVTNVETINMYLDGSDADGFTIASGGGSDGVITATTVNVIGGVTDGVYTIADTMSDVAGKVINAGQSNGSIELSFGDDALIVSNTADPLTITGGQGSADKLTIVMTNSNTGTFTMSGVETIVAGNSGGASTIDLTNVNDVTNIVLHDSATTGTNFVLSAVDVGTAVTLGLTGTGTAEFDAQSVDINLGDATGTSDSITINLVDTDGSGSSTATIDVDGIETTTLALADSAEDHIVDLDNNLSAASLVVTGENTSADLTIAGLEAGFTTVTATNLAGSLNIAASARGSDAMTITGGTGADTITMENTADVLTGGAGTTVDDNLVINFGGTGGALIVDLSSTGDQVTMFNGLANSASQSGFEDVDASSYTQTGSQGADITGSTAGNVIVGTGYADTIRAGEGVDTLTGGAGNDTITTGAGADTIVITSTDGTDTITDFTGGSGGDKFDDTGLEAITTQDVNFAKLAAGAAVVDVGVTGGIFSADVDVAAAASMAVSDVNTLLATTLSKTISAADDGEKAILIVSTDADAAVDSYMYIIEHDGTDFDGVTLLGTLEGTQLDTLTADNFVGYA